MPPNETIEAESSDGGIPRKRSRIYLSIVLSIAVLAAGVVGTAYIGKNAPKARKRPPEKMTPLVQVSSVHPDTHKVVVAAMGTVIPAREIILESRVAGEIVAIHPEFTVGGFLDKGSEILRIDPEDYQLAVTLAQAKIKDSESVLKVVQEEAAASEEEWRLLYKANPQGYKIPALVAKKPQLEAAKAKLAADGADLQKAKLNLARTRIRAPFNAIVRAKQVDIGSQVSSQEHLAELVGTDTYWIRASIPIDRLSWILIPGNPAGSGARVRISYRNGYELAGTVIKLLGDLETEGRMARILVEVQDPLGLKIKGKYQLPLLIGEYVRIEIEGRELQNVYRIPRSALRDDSNIWIASDDGRLEIRSVKTLWRDAQTVVLAEGLEPNSRLIVSDLAVPVNGMPVKVAE
ncbi:MAG: efflux RND transporter periplasmic adaptor subunit [Desulfobacterales bacterium]|nr:efflux RND transporter periplasmic adaptor subunit [Desulfobacterales bacterium]